MTASPPKSPGIRFPPPILFVAGIVAGWLMHRLVPLPISALLVPDLRVPLAWAAIITGMGVAAWAMVTFAAARTAIYPNDPARVIVTTGPYRYSRNPMYVGVTMLATGVGLWLDSLWVLASIPVALWMLTVLVIRREEAYLSSAFREPYGAYRAQVRRWL